MKIFVRKEEKKNLYVCPACAATLAITEPGKIPAIRPGTCLSCGEDLDWTQVEAEEERAKK